MGSFFCKRAKSRGHIVLSIGIYEQIFLFRLQIAFSLFFVSGLSNAQDNFSSDVVSVKFVPQRNDSYSTFFYEESIDSNSSSPIATFTAAISGNWSSPATWGAATVPGPGDDVIIPAGVMVSITGNTSTCQNITINNNGSLVVNGSFNLDVNGSWINDGNFTASTGTVTFKGIVGTTTTISGSSPTAFYNITIDKGTDVNSIVEANGTGAISNTGTLTINNGLFKVTKGAFQFLSGTSATIPSTAGLWVNGGTVISVSNSANGFSMESDGWIKVSSGSLNVGTATGNSLTTSATTGKLEIAGGIVNIAGGLINTNGVVLITGGAINICTIGQSSSRFGSFHMSLSTALTISGDPVINILHANGGTAGDITVLNSTGRKSITGGTFQLGPNAGTYKIDAAAPLYNLTILNPNAPAQLGTVSTGPNTYTYDLVITNQLTLNGQLQLNDQNLILGVGTPAIGGTLGAHNGMIITKGAGEVRKISSVTTAYTFPVGTSADDYSPISIHFTSITPGANPYVGVSVVNAKYPNNSNTIDFLKRYWNVRLNDITNAVYNATATYLPGDIIGNEANIKAGEYSNSLSRAKHSQVNTGSHILSVTGIQPVGELTALSGIALADGTSTTIVSDNDPACENTQVTFTATVTTTGGTTPTGTVEFFDGGVSIGTGSLATVNATTATATFQTFALIPGPHTITAKYNGDVNNDISTSGDVIQNINATPTVTANDKQVCFGNNSVALTGTPAGGTWSGTGVTGSTFNANTLAAGNYTVTYTYTDGSNCTNSATATVTVHPLPIVTADDKQVCFGNNSVALTSTPAGGTWIGTGVAGSTFNANTLAAGNYTANYTYTDGNNCTNSATTTVTVNALPIVTANDKQVCFGNNSVALTGTPAGGTWSGTGVTGSTFNANTLAAGNYTVTYTYTDGSNCTNSATATVTVNPALPVSVTIQSSDADNTICAGESVTFTATPTNGGSAPLYQWRVNALNVPGATSPTFTTSTLQNGYVVSVVLTSNASPCAVGSPALSNNITTTVNAIPTITGTTPGSVCETGTVTLGATASAGTVNWYDVATGGASLGTGISFITPVISTTTTYYVDATSNGCTTSSRTPVIATVNAVPAITATTPGSVCGSGTVTLGAATSAGTINWYAAATGGTSLGTGTSFTTPGISSTTTYYVDATSNGCTTASRTAVTAIVNTVPTITATTPASVCGSGTATLGATASGGTINWYASATGGTSLGTGTSFNTPSLSSTTTYYVDATSNGCTTASRTAVTATVNAIPTITATTPANVCGSGTVTLGATASAGTINWYDVATGGTSLGTGTSYTTPGISTTTTYYADATSNGCTAVSRTPVIATVNTIPTITGTTPGSVCGSGSVTLGATGSAGTVSWYAAATGGTSLGTGTSFTTPGISTTTTYYADATSNGCTSASRTPVIATVNTVPAITATIPASVCGSGALTLGATASAGTINWYAAATGGTSLGAGTGFTTPNISTTTTYYVDATLNACTTASRTAVIATVNPNVAPSVSIAASSATICAGTSVAFTATPTNGGSSPSYQWKVNGANVGTNSPTYTTATLTNGQIVTVVMTSNATCASPTGATSNSINMAVYTGNPNNSGGPAANRQITGPSSVCPGPSATGLVYTAPINLTNTSTYTWTLPPGFTITSGAGTNQITVSVLGPGVVSGPNTLTLKATNPCNATGLTITFTVTVNSFNAINVGADFSMCQGNTATLTNALSGAASRVTWRTTTGTITGGPYPTGFVYTPPAGFTGTATLIANTDTAAGNCAGTSFDSDTVVVTVNEPPAITNQPVATQTLCSGSTATFSVTATGTGLTYQWKKNGTNISGAIASTYTINNVSTADAATYTVVVAGASPCAPVTSTDAVLNVNQGVALTTQPSSKTLCSGSTATFNVVATGTGLTYQWQKDGSDITGATSATYTINNVSGSDGGAYTVLVSGTAPCGSVASSPATLVVNDAVVITTQPSSQTLCSGSTATFTVTATGTGLTYQWKKNGTNIPGATSSTYTINNVSTANAGNYTVVVSGVSPCSPTTSATASLVVNRLVAIATQPLSKTLCSGSTATFTVVATGTGLTYQWQKDGADITGATSATYTIGNVSVSDGGAYTVVVSGTAPCGSVTSSPATLVVNDAVVINTQPSSQTLCSGSTATFSIAATGTSLTYQWKKNGTNIPGATSSAYTINNVSTTDAGNYTAVVSGVSPCAPVTSSTATLAVNQAVAITSQPVASQVTCSGFAISFSVTATGTGLTYQWKKDGVDVPGATSSAYSIANTSTADAGTYTVVVSGAAPCSSVTSQNAVLVVNEDITITSQPAPLALCVGNTATFTVNATGNISSYQWRKGVIPISDGGNISGATTATLTITNLSASNAGTFNVVISSPSGSCAQTISNPATLTVNTKSANPTSATASSTTICNGQSTTLTLNGGGGGTNETIHWYSGSCGGTPVGTGNGLSVSPAGTTTYYGRFEDGAPCNYNSACASVTITVNQKSADPISATASSTTICNGQSTALTLSGGGDGDNETIHWYAGTCGGTSVGTGNNLSVSPTVTTTYYGRYEDGAPCNYNSACVSVTITVNQKSTDPTSATASSNTICKGQSTTLTLTGGGSGANETIHWYSGSCGGTSVGTGNNLSVSPTVTTTYYGRYEDGAPCDYNSPCTSVTITVNQKSADPTSATASSLTICNGQSTTLTLSGGGGGNNETIHWYGGSCGGTSVGTGNNLSVSPTLTTTYYGRYEDGAPCNYNSACATVTITVNQKSVNPTSAAASLNTICNGQSTVLTLNGGGGSANETIHWYSGTCGGTSVGTGNNLSVSPTVTMTYYGRYEDGAPCNYNSACASVTITVNQKSVDPTSAIASSPTICNGQSTTLTLSGGGGGANETIHWYTGSCGGASVGTGNNLSVSPTVTTTYYGRYEDGAPCNYNSTCASVTITVNSPSVGGTISPAVTSVCANSAGGTLILTSYTGTIVRWESSRNGGGTWTPIANTSNTQAYTTTQTTLYRAVVQNSPCAIAYSSNAVVAVVPTTTPTATSSPAQICLGQSANLAARSGLPKSWADFDATFNNANPAGWTVTENGTEIIFPANADNASTFPWSETNGPKTPFNGGVTYNNLQSSGKFAIASGQVTTTLETPVFSTIGMTSATLQFYQALVFAAGASGKIEISTDGGATYNTTLIQYNGPLTIGIPANSWSPLNIDLSSYIGLSNLRIRFTYSGTGNSNWAIDGLALQPPGPTITYNWTLIDPSGVPSPYYLNATDQQNVIATPPAPGTYTYQVATTISGCPGGTANVQVVVMALPVITPVNSCIGSGSVTFTQTGGATGGRWTVSGGGNINSTTGVFTPSTPGCFTVTYTTPAPGCTDTKNFVVFPAAPTITAIANECDSKLANINAIATVPGFTAEYAVQAPDGILSAYSDLATVNALLTNTPGCWTIKARYKLTADCGGTTGGTLSSNVACEEGTINAVVFPAAPSLTPLANTCDSKLADVIAVASVPGFTAEYALQAPGGTLSAYGDLATANALLTNTPGCWTIKARYKLTEACGGTAANATSTNIACQETTINAVVFPPAPILTTGLSTCNTSFALPSIATVPGFIIEYSIDGGVYSASPSVSAEPGCHTVQAQYVLAAACGSTPVGSTGAGSCGASNMVSVLIFPAAPPAPTVNSGCGPIVVTPPAEVPGFNIEYSFDDGATWGGNNPPTAENCSGYQIRTRYALATDCGGTLAGTSGPSGCDISPATTRKIDNTGPDVTCPTVTPLCEVASSTYTIPALIASDNCTATANLTISYVISGATTRSGSGVDASGSFGAGISIITWTVTDECGNTNSCTTSVPIYPKPTPIIYHN